LLILLKKLLCGYAIQVGIIMYLPTLDPRQRKDITEEFFNYRSLTQTSLWDDYSAYEHWAKIEVPTFTSTSKMYAPTIRCLLVSFAADMVED
jgi:hypothetical protein